MWVSDALMLLQFQKMSQLWAYYNNIKTFTLSEFDPLIGKNWSRGPPHNILPHHEKSLIQSCADSHKNSNLHDVEDDMISFGQRDTSVYHREHEGWEARCGGEILYFVQDLQFLMERRTQKCPCKLLQIPFYSFCLIKEQNLGKAIMDTLRRQVTL